jgi:aquaporin Z
VFVGDWALSQLWLFIVAPLLGGLVGALLHAVVFNGNARIDPAESAVAAR